MRTVEDDLDEIVGQDVTELIRSVGGDYPEQEAKELLDAAEGSSNGLEKLDEFLHRRTKLHEPVAYILGKVSFYGLELKCDARALIPRAETETLVEAGLEAPLFAHVADVGTGSGAVAIALKDKRRDLTVTGIDISKDALDLACVNAELHNVDVNWRDGDLLTKSRNRFDVVLANLPYLPKSKFAEYPPEMVDNEPEISLWGGDDGYDLIKRLLAQLRVETRVKLVALETGLGQAETVMDFVRLHGFPIVYGITDKKGDIRAVVGKRS